MEAEHRERAGAKNEEGGREGGRETTARARRGGRHLLLSRGMEDRRQTEETALF